MDEKTKPDFLTLLRDMLNDHLGKAEFTEAFAKVVETIKELRQDNEAEFSSIYDTVAALGNKLRDDNSSDLTTFKDEAKSVLDTALAAALATISQTVVQAETRVAEIRDGEQGPQGEQGPVGPAGSPDMAEDIRNKLELLEGDERLRIEAIKDLPEELEKLRKKLGSGGGSIGMHGPLWALTDVDVVGIVPGQVLQWDGVRWIPYTPTGGAGTSVYNEVVAGSANTFTLANAPTAGTERIYANGQRLLPTTDYSLAGAVITTVLSWEAGMISADYQY